MILNFIINLLVNIILWLGIRCRSDNGAFSVASLLLNSLHCTSVKPERLSFYWGQWRPRYFGLPQFSLVVSYLFWFLNYYFYGLCILATGYAMLTAQDKSQIWAVTELRGIILLHWHPVRKRGLGFVLSFQLFMNWRVILTNMVWCQIWVKIEQVKEGGFSRDKSYLDKYSHKRGWIRGSLLVPKLS